MEINTKGVDWGSGLDLNYGAFKFADGDTITITGKVDGTPAKPWMFDMGLGAAESPLGGESFATGDIDTVLEIDAEGATKIAGFKPAALRFNCKAKDVKVEIYTLVVEGFRAGGEVFDAVTDISGVPTSAYINRKVTLGGSVEPSYATNKTIVWTFKSSTAGVTALTEETVDDEKVQTFTATQEGNVVVTATVADGAAKGTPFVKDFTIEITDPVFAKVKVGGASAAEVDVEINAQTYGDAAGVTKTATGFSYDTNNYGTFIYFQVNLGTKKASEITAIKATINVEGTDSEYKGGYIAVSSTKFTGYPGQGTGAGNTWTQSPEHEVTFNKFAPTATDDPAGPHNPNATGTVWISLALHMPTGQTVTYTNPIVIEF